MHPKPGDELNLGKKNEFNNQNYSLTLKDTYPRIGDEVTPTIKLNGGSS